MNIWQINLPVKLVVTSVGMKLIVEFGVMKELKKNSVFVKAFKSLRFEGFVFGIIQKIELSCGLSVKDNSDILEGETVR